jgi:predicted DNA-binding transcriptional regulator AlpA
MYIIIGCHLWATNVIAPKLPKPPEITRRTAMINHSSELLTAREVAAYLDYSLRTIWRWTALGELPPPVRFHRQVYWKREEIESFRQRLPLRRPRRRAKA